jgi:hypothetical protein
LRVVVDLAVTVVVQPVAKLNRGALRAGVLAAVGDVAVDVVVVRDADGHLALAGFAGVRADRGVAVLHYAAETALATVVYVVLEVEALVCLSVAVVVDPVAVVERRRGDAVILATIFGDVVIVGKALIARDDGAFSLSAAMEVYVGQIADLEAAPTMVRVVLRLRPDIGIVVIDEPIAVIVHPIAPLAGHFGNTRVHLRDGAVSQPYVDLLVGAEVAAPCRRDDHEADRRGQPDSCP